MSPESAWQRWQALDRWARLALAVWLVMTLAVCARSAARPHHQTVYPVWKGAGHDWRTGHDLYDDRPSADATRFGFRYSPLVAAGFTLCDLVPERAGNVLWRVVNAIAFLAALAWWLRDGVPLQATPGQRGLVILLTAPVALGSLNNGQANLLMVALLLGCITALAVERWNIAAVCAALAVLLKIYPIALVLLLALAYPRRFAPRFVLALLLLSALPFLMQRPDYVARQYALWWERVSHNDAYRRTWPLAAGYRDVWMLVRVWQLPVSLKQYTALQLAGAGTCAAVTALSAWRLGRDRRLLLVALTLATGWMLLLGPAPESCTYVLIAPALGWWLVQTWRQNHPVAHYLAAQCYGLLLGAVVTGTSTHGIQLYHVPGLQPLAVMCFLAGFLGVVIVWLVGAGWDGQVSMAGEGDRPAHRAA
jgi:hypothetical protein